MRITNSDIKQFLKEGYAFRRNLLSGKIEYRELNEGGDSCTSEQGDSLASDASEHCLVHSEKCVTHSEDVWRALTAEDMNSLALATEEAMPEAQGVGKKLTTIIYSRETPDYDPVREWLMALPAWDGKNHAGALFDRLPGIRSEQRYWLSIWLRSMVAHWLQMDALHGNEVVPTLIGAQGCGKSTFCRLLLPEHLREYFLDHVNLGNKFDKEMALTNNLLVNIDELDQVRRCQQAELKQLLSKVRVNGRPIYGRVQADRRRYASFVATTNNLHPLHDPTGSRRFLCIEIAAGSVIDNLTPVNYEQLYAQVLSELRNNERYWLTEAETRSLQLANAPYESTHDLEQMVDVCFRQPAADEPCEPLPMSTLVKIVTKEYPFIEPTHSTKVQLGIALSARGYQMARDADGRFYYAVPRITALSPQVA